METEENKVSKKKSRKMKQSTAVKLLSSLSAAALILVFAMLVFNMSASNRFDVYAEKGEITAGYVDDFVNASAYLTQEVRFYAATGDRVHYDNYWREVNTDKRREKAVENLQKAGITEEENGFITEIQNTSNNLIAVEEKSMQMAEQGVNSQAINMVFDDGYQNALDKIGKLQQELKSSVLARIEAEQNRLGDLIDLTFYLTFASLVLVVVIQGVVIFYVLRSILNPLLRFKENMGLMAKGILDAKLGVEEDDTEVGELASGINHTKRQTVAIVSDIDHVLEEMADGNFAVELDHADQYVGVYESIYTSMNTLKQRQNETLIQISTAADQVAVGAGQVSDGAQALAQGATEQASAVEELAATIEDISNNSEGNSKNSALALEHSREASSFVTESADNIGNMVSAMDEISQSSQKIEKIIATIENIAFQTNILALNAAVEAARAGSAGKGFAVVADEVRNLASKSDEAAKATKELIGNAMQSVKNGEAIVEKVSQTLGATIDSSRQAEQDIAQITDAITQETQSINQVAEGVEQISSVVQTNSATSEESAAASEELSSQAQLLKDLVNRFKLVDGSEF